jgi:uncharacterized protein YndB with AHSA1/START domain
MAEQDYNAVAAIDINAPTKKVWDALINPEMVKKYLHDTNMITNWKIGSSIIWRGVWDDKSYEDKGVVLAFEPNKLLSTTHWSPMTGSEDKPENYHTVTYELTPIANDGTRLVLTQSNNPTQEAADSMVENGWMPTLQAMKSLLEE